MLEHGQEFRIDVRNRSTWSSFLNLPQQRGSPAARYGNRHRENAESTWNDRGIMQVLPVLKLDSQPQARQSS